MTSSASPRPLSPLTDDQSQRLGELTAGMDNTTLLWLSGYLAGRAEQRDPPTASRAQPAANSPQLTRATVLYGSQTGNAKRIATELADGYAAKA